MSTVNIELPPAQAAVLDALNDADRLLSAAEIFERCAEIETIAAVHTALHVLHRRGFVLREESTEKAKNGKLFYLYCPAGASPRRNPDPAPVQDAVDAAPVCPEFLADMAEDTRAEFVAALANPPVVDPEAVAFDAGLNALADYLAKDLGAAAGLDFEPYPEETDPPPGFDPRAAADRDPVLSDIAAVRETLRAPRPIWTDDDIRQMRALAEALDGPALVGWLYTVAARMLGEDVP